MTRLAARLWHFGRDNWLLVAAFVAAAGIALWFAVRIALNFVYFNDPRNVDVDLEPWMTPRFIVMTYDLPRDYVMGFLQLDPDVRERRPLHRVAADLGLTMPELTALVRDRAAAYREGRP